MATFLSHISTQQSRYKEERKVLQKCETNVHNGTYLVRGKNLNGYCFQNLDLSDLLGMGLVEKKEGKQPLCFEHHWHQDDVTEFLARQRCRVVLRWAPGGWSKGKIGFLHHHLFLPPASSCNLNGAPNSHVLVQELGKPPLHSTWEERERERERLEGTRRLQCFPAVPDPLHPRCQASLKARASHHSCALQPAFSLPAPFGSPGAGRRGGLDGVDAKAISRVLQGQQRLLIGLMVILHGETGTRRAASSGDRPQLERQTGEGKAEPLSQVLPRQQAGPKRAAASWMGRACLAGKRAVERARSRFRGGGAWREVLRPGLQSRRRERKRTRSVLFFFPLLPNASCFFFWWGAFFLEEGVIFKPARTQDTLSFLFYELGSSNVLLLALLFVLSPQTDAARVYL